MVVVVIKSNHMVIVLFTHTKILSAQKYEGLFPEP